VREGDEEAVPAVFHVGDDALAAGRHRVVGVGRVDVVVLRPVAPLDVEDEAELVRVAPPHPAEVQPPEGGGRAVVEPDDLVTVDRTEAKRVTCSPWSEKRTAVFSS
jgi:hypothetical protein